MGNAGCVSAIAGAASTSITVAKFETIKMVANTRRCQVVNLLDELRIDVNIDVLLRDEVFLFSVIAVGDAR